MGCVNPQLLAVAYHSYAALHSSCTSRPSSSLWKTTGLSMHLQRTPQSPSKSFLSYVPSANTHAMDAWGKTSFLWQLAMLTPQLCSFLFIAHLKWVVQFMVFTAFMSTSWVLHPCIPTTSQLIWDHRLWNLIFFLFLYVFQLPLWHCTRLDDSVCGLQQHDFSSTCPQMVSPLPLLP